MDLFDPPGAVEVVADEEGGIRYWPGFVPLATADDWMAALRGRVAWTEQRRPMYDRVVDVPRLLAAYRVAALPAGLPLGDMLARVAARVPAPYDAIGLNLYRDGRDSVAMHNDKLDSIAPGHPIALVSLGAPRRMLIRAKPAPGDEPRAAPALRLDLAPGSLLAMSHASQRTHDHGIPKTRQAVGPRMSVVFRVRPPGWSRD